MSDFQHIRCRACCTAASGGDALAHDSNLHAPFIGGFIDCGNNTRSYTVDAALAVAKELRAASAPLLALSAAVTDANKRLAPDWVCVEADIQVNGYSIDPEFFAEHGDHDLVGHCYGDYGNCSRCFVEHGVHRGKHEGPHGRNEP